MASEEKGTARKTENYSHLIKVKLSQLLREAIELRQAGKPKESIAKLNRALFLDSNQPELFRERAEAYFMLQDFSNAILNMGRVLLLSDVDQDQITAKIGLFHFHHALKLLEDKKHVEALDKLGLAESRGFKDKRILERKVECLVALKRYTDCLQVIEVEIENNPSSVDLLVTRAQLHILFGDVTKGYWDVCKALEKEEDHPEALEMKEDLEKKASLCKDRAVHQLLVGNNRDALHKISQAISTNPSAPDYHILRGTLYRKTQNFTEAVDDYLKAMDKCGHQQDLPVYKQASRQLVLTYNDFALNCFKKKRFENAIALLNKAIQEEKWEKGLYLNRGDCFYRTNKLRFALSDYKQALELDPSQWDIYCRVAVVCSEIGVELFGKQKLEEAEAFFTTAIHHNPKVARFYLCRARTRLERKNIGGAREDTVSSLTLDSKSDECIPIIARIFPGKLKEEILWLQPASKEIQSNLKSLKEKMALPPKVSKAPGKGGGVRPYSPLHMFNLDLKMAEEERECSGNEPEDVSKESAKLEQVEDRSKSNIEEESIGRAPPSGFLPQLGVDLQVAGQSACSRGLAPTSLYKRSDDPLPPLPSGGRHLHQNIMPELQDCLQEENFHREIYYSKKYCGRSLKKLLQVFPAEPSQRSAPKSTLKRSRHRTF